MAAKKNKAALYQCRLCDAKFSNVKEKDAHYSGPFHKFMTGVRRTQLSYMGNVKTLNEQMTETGKKESLIGLEYIYEYAEDSQGVRMYECKLCSSAFRVASIFFHIVGVRHRILYLAKHHPIMGIEDDYEVQQQVHFRKLTNHALAIEQTHGRKKINVVEEVYVSKPNISEVSDIEMYLVDNIPSKIPETKKDENKDVVKENSKTRRARYRAEKFKEILKSRQEEEDRTNQAKQHDRDSSSRSDSKDLPKYLIHDDDFDARTVSKDSSSAPRLNLGKDSSSSDAKADSRKRSRPPRRRSRSKTRSSHISRSLDDCGDIDVRSVLPSGGISFRELKAANIVHGNVSSAQLPVSKKKKKKTDKDKDSDSDMDVCSMDFSECEPEDFWCNEELFDFLKCYHIGDEEDVQFILEAIKVLSHSLVRHKTRMEDLKKWITQEKQRLEKEKKVFQEMKKRKENKITSMKSIEPDILKLFHDVTRSQNKPSFGTGKDTAPVTAKASGEKVAQKLPVSAQTPGVIPPLLGPGFQKALTTGTAAVQKAGQKRSAQNITPTSAAHQKALMAGVGQILQQLFLRCQATASPSNPTPGPVGGIGPVQGAASYSGPSQTPQIPGARFNNPDPSEEKKPPLMPLMGVRLSGYPVLTNPSQPQQQAAPSSQGSETLYSQNPGLPATRLDNLNPQKDIRSLMGQAVVRYPGLDSCYNQNEAFPGPQTDKLGAANKTGLPLGADAASRFNQNPPSHYDTRGPVDGAGAAPGPGPITNFNQTPQVPVSRFDHPSASKDARPIVGQAAGRYLESDGRYNQKEPYPGARTDSNVSFDKTRPPLGAGSETGFSQNPQIPGPRFDNPNTSNQPKPFMGQATGRYPESDGRYNQNEPYPGARTENSGSLDKTRPPLGAGSDMRFSQNPQISGPRFDNPNTSNQPKPVMGQAASRYPESDDCYYEDESYPGAWTENSGSLDKTRPPLGAGSEMRFSQNPQIPGPRFDNPNTSNQPKSFMGQEAGRYPESEGHYNQNAPYPGARTENSGSLDKTRPPLGADQQGNYKPMAWNSGPPSGNQGFYNAAPPVTGMGTGKYDDQYTQKQWQSQYSSKGPYAGGMDRPPEPQSLPPQPATSTAYSSDGGRPGTWPSQSQAQAPAKPGVYPAGILKKRPANPP